MCTEKHLLFKASPSDSLIINYHMALARRAPSPPARHPPSSTGRVSSPRLPFAEHRRCGAVTGSTLQARSSADTTSCTRQRRWVSRGCREQRCAVRCSVRCTFIISPRGRAANLGRDLAGPRRSSLSTLSPESNTLSRLMLCGQLLETRGLKGCLYG